MTIKEQLEAMPVMATTTIAGVAVTRWWEGGWELGTWGQQKSVRLEVAVDRLSYVPIAALDAAGERFWYTGRTGDGWVSKDRSDAFFGYTLEGAQRKAMLLNRGTELHGLLFVAVTGDLR